jgi:elongation factor Ts
MGKYASIIELRMLSGRRQGEDSAATDIAHKLGQHVVGMSPATVGTATDKPAKKRDEESRMIHQEFLTDPSITVNDYLTEAKVKVTDFVRFECGETLQGDDK